MVTEQTTPYDISIVMPCLNEEQTVGYCVAEAKQFLDEHDLLGEVIVADNGSTDRSIDIAREHGARVIHVPEKGYGNALRYGFAAANSTYIIMGDSDGNHDFSSLMPFVDKLHEGYDLVVGNRFAGGIAPDAMSWMRRYIGNPILSFIGRLFFNTPVRDFHCGLRGIRKDVLTEMQLKATGMELASEMIIKSYLLDLQVTEVPTRQLPDAPGRESHLNPWRDGWRHLRFLLLYSPQWLFLYPSLLMLLIGGGLSARLLIGPIDIGSGILDFHTLIYAGTFSIIGLTLLSFAIISHAFAFRYQLLPPRSPLSSLYKRLKLEHGILLGSVLVGMGFLIMVWTFYLGISGEFQTTTRASTIRLVYGSSLLLITGVQVIFTNFVVSILKLPVRTSSS